MPVSVSAAILQYWQFFDPSTNQPLNGGKVFIYQTGTTTKVTGYSDSAGTLALTNPVILDTVGRPTTNGTTLTTIYLPVATTCKFVITRSTDTDPPTAAIDTIDPWYSGAQVVHQSALYDSANNIAIQAGLGSGTIVNNVTVTNAATTLAPIIAATGTDTNIGLTIDGKGSGVVNIAPTATGAVNIGNANTTGALTLQTTGAVNIGTDAIGTIQIGNTNGNGGASAINIGDPAAGGTGNITVTSTSNSVSAITLTTTGSGSRINLVPASATSTLALNANANTSGSGAIINITATGGTGNSNINIVGPSNSAGVVIGNSTCGVKVTQNTHPTTQGTVGQSYRIGTTAGTFVFKSPVHWENTQVGTASLSIPADVTQIQYLVVGGGGAGGTASGTGSTGGGGGAGGITYGMTSVTPGGTLTLTVGAAGSSSTITGGGLANSITAGNGSAGTASSGTTIAGVAGGAGGTVTNANSGAVNLPGSAGHPGIITGAAGNGGPGLYGSGAGLGAAAAGVGGAAGASTGAGGGGGYGGSGTGGAGAAGQIVVWY